MPTTTILPSVGAEIPCSCYAANVPLKIRTALVNVEFKGGIKVRVEAHPSEPAHKAVVLKVIGHKVEADHPQLGKITIEQENMEATPDSLLNIVQHFPPKLSAVMFLSFKLTVERPPGQGANEGARPEPLVLRTKEPAKLLSPELSKFPPDGDFYRLENPIKLVHPDTDQVVATIDKFPVRVGG
ncbi:hypothetical protein AB0A69_11755 [Streptomyces sp. NPDC045431]|uniref:hypothetical protein n=1 Tax=Streptomyces sp. NPDC045431 TaxID=3155613 RepID=UPI0033DA13C9